MFRQFFFKSHDFFNVKTDPEGHVTVLDVKVLFEESPASLQWCKWSRDDLQK